MFAMPVIECEQPVGSTGSAQTLCLSWKLKPKSIRLNHSCKRAEKQAFMATTMDESHLIIRGIPGANKMKVSKENQNS